MSVQRKVITVFRNKHVCQQAGGPNALINDMRWHRRLGQGLALAAHPFATNVTLDGEHARRVVELLADVRRCA